LSSSEPVDDVARLLLAALVLLLGGNATRNVDVVVADEPVLVALIDRGNCAGTEG
jgi:hypothetical protein